MPNGAFLYADQLNEVLTAKSEQGGFKELVGSTCTLRHHKAQCMLLSTKAMHRQPGCHHAFAMET